MNTSTTLNKSILIIALFCGLLISSLFWIIGTSFNIYTYVATGVIFEMLWFPILFLTFMILIVSLYFWYKDKWNFKSIFLYIIVASALLICLLII
ncbi:hypothetical protein D3C87_243610 [compost metagenome]